MSETGVDANIKQSDDVSHTGGVTPQDLSGRTGGRHSDCQIKVPSATGPASDSNTVGSHLKQRLWINEQKRLPTVWVLTGSSRKKKKNCKQEKKKHNVDKYDKTKCMKNTGQVCHVTDIVFIAQAVSTIGGAAEKVWSTLECIRVDCRLVIPVWLLTALALLTRTQCCLVVNRLIQANTYTKMFELNIFKSQYLSTTTTLVYM